MFNFFNDITFANKELLWLLLVIPTIMAWYIWKNNSFSADIKISTLSGFSGLKKSAKHYLRHILIALLKIILKLSKPFFHTHFLTLWGLTHGCFLSL